MINWSSLLLERGLRLERNVRRREVYNMIELLNGKHVLRFGAGDILIIADRIENDKDELTSNGIICFENREPHKIGSSCEYPTGKIDYEGDPNIQVCMTFSKTESIDVLINKLEHVKILMKKNKG